MLVIIFLVLWVIIALVSAWFLLKINKKHNERVIVISSLFLIIQKTVEHLYFWSQGVFTKVPVDFSAIAYFLFPIAFLQSIKILKPFVTYIAFLSGVIFLIALPLKGTWFIDSWGVPMALLSFLNHTLLFLVSLLVMKYHLFNIKSIKSIAVFTFLSVGFAIFMENMLNLENSGYFIYQVLDGRILANTFLETEFTWYTYSIYMSIIILIYLGMIFLFIKINNMIYMKYHNDISSSEAKKI